jgi:hypothetical protein
MTSREHNSYAPVLRKVRKAYVAMKDALYAILLWLAGNILWDLVLIGFCSSIIAYIAKKKAEWAAPALYFVITACCIFVIQYTLIGKPLLSHEQPQTTTENIESNIKVWADKFSLGIQKEKDDRFSFAYIISLPSGRLALVGCLKEREGYLQFQGKTTVTPEQEVILKKFSPSQIEHLTDEISIEMARSRINWWAVNESFEKGIIVAKAIPITSNLTEDVFGTTLDDIDHSMLLAREAIRLALAHVDAKARPHPAPSQ